MAARVTIVKPLGLIMDANEYAIPQGAFLFLHNFATREPGYLSLLPGPQTLDSDMGTLIGEFVWPIPDEETADAIAAREVLALYDWNTDEYAPFQYSNDAGATANITMPDGYGPEGLALDARAGFMAARDRGFLAMANGLVAMTVDAPAATPRAGGLLPPQLLELTSITSTNAIAIETNTCVAYRAVFRRRESDGYEITSAPSYPIAVPNVTAFTMNANLFVGWSTLNDWNLRDGDFVDIYRTRAVADSVEPNDTYYLAQSIAVVAADIAAGGISITDSCPPDGLGQELYTNPGQQGAGEANAVIGPLADAAIFADHAFYVAPQLRSYVSPRVKARFGYLLDSDAQRVHGVGTRDLTGSATNGSPVITGVAAGDFLGLEVGQGFQHSTLSYFPAGTTILVLNSGAGTITLSANSTVTGAAQVFYAYDLLYIASTDGSNVTASCRDFFYFARSIYDADVPFVVTPSWRPRYGDPQPRGSADGASFVIQQVTNASDAWPTIVCVGITSIANWSAINSEFNGTEDKRGNRVLWSKRDQPEHVPASHELTIGGGTLLRLLPLPEALLCFCTDGLYRVTGFDGRWVVDLVDATVVIPNQQAVSSMNGRAYAYAKDLGLLRIGPNGVEANLTRGAIQDVVEVYLQLGLESPYNIHVACDPLHAEVAFFERNPPGSGSVEFRGNVSTWVFNERQQAWRSQDANGGGDVGEFSAFAYSPYRRSLVWVRPSLDEAVAQLKQYLSDYDLRTRLNGYFSTRRIVPDGDTVAMKRFLEVTVQAESTATDPPELVMATGSASTTVEGKSTDPFGTVFTMRLRVGRNDGAVGNAIQLTCDLGGTVANVGEYTKIAAIGIQWQPESEMGQVR